MDNDHGFQQSMTNPKHSPSGEIYAAAGARRDSTPGAGVQLLLAAPTGRNAVRAAGSVFAFVKSTYTIPLPL